MSQATLEAIRMERRNVRTIARRLSLASGGCCQVLTVDGGYWLRVGMFDKVQLWADGPHEFGAVYYRALVMLEVAA